MAPVDGRGQGAVARQDRARLTGKQPKTVVEFPGDLLCRHVPAAGRRQFDGQWDPVEAAADLGNGGGVLFRHRERRPSSPGAVEEQAHGVVLREDRYSQGVLNRRSGQGGHAPGHLAGHPQWLATGGQHAGGLVSNEQLGDQLGAPVEQVLAVVEHQQRGLDAQFSR